MAIAQVGSVIEIQTTSGNSSQSISVPVGADVAVIFILGVNTTGTLTLGGNSCTRRAPTSGNFFNEAWTYTSPPSGSQTLAWNFTREGLETCFLIVFYSGVDTTAPVRDADSDDGGNAASTAVTPSMTSQAGDLAVGGASSYIGWSTPIDLDNNGQTALHSTTFDYGDVNDDAGGIATKVATGSTITIEVYGDYPNVAAVVLAAMSAALDQEGFRFRNDDGSESAATWKAAQDTNITLAADTAARLRLLINATGDPASKNYQLEYRHKPSGGSYGSWKKVIPTQ